MKVNILGKEFDVINISSLNPNHFAFRPYEASELINFLKDKNILIFSGNALIYREGHIKYADEKFTFDGRDVNESYILAMQFLDRCDKKFDEVTLIEIAFDGIEVIRKQYPMPMEKIFNDKEYDFSNSIVDFIKINDDNVYDFDIGISHIQGQVGTCVLRLQSIKKLVYKNNDKSDNKDITQYIIGSIKKSTKDGYNELIIKSYKSDIGNGEPLISCLCEEVYIDIKGEI